MCFKAGVLAVLSSINCVMWFLPFIRVSNNIFIYIVSQNQGNLSLVRTIVLLISRQGLLLSRSIETMALME